MKKVFKQVHLADRGRARGGKGHAAPFQAAIDFFRLDARPARRGHAQVDNAHNFDQTSTSGNTMSIKLLHLDSSILGEHSVSRQLSAAVIQKLLATAPNAIVTYRDLASQPIPHLSGATLLAGSMPHMASESAVQTDMALGATVLEEFLAADVIVIGVGFYNFGIPSQLKAWVDRIAVAGKTFRYTENGVEGLAKNKRVILAMARGGYYGPGTPNAMLEHAETYLRGVFAFTGVKQLEVVVAEGVKVSEEQRAAAIAQARRTIDELRFEERV